MKLKTITPPTSEPMTIEEAKRHLKIDGNDEDADLPGLIKHAREYCEDYQNRKYVTQTLEAYLDCYPCGSIEFRNCSPVQSIESLKYVDSDGIENTFDNSNYSLDDVSFVHKIDLNYGKSWPSVTLKPVNGIKIRFIAGFGNAAAVPETVKQAMKLHMKLLHDSYSPDEFKKLEGARDALLSMNRVVPV